MITVQVPFSPDFLAQIADLPRRWDADLKAWAFPPEAARRLLDRQLPEPHRSILSTAVASWKEDVNPFPPVSQSALRLPPGLPPLYRHQLDAIDLLAHGSGLLWHDMGLGKTRAALLTAQAQGERLVVVCPAIAKAVWAHEARLLGMEEPVILDGLSIKTKKSADTWRRAQSAQIVILNFDILYAWTPALMELRPFILCVDESHKLRTPSNRWTKAIRPLTLTAPKTWLLTGTAMVNSALDIYWQLGLFGVRSPFTGVRVRDFGQRYCERKWNPFKGKAGDWDYAGVKDEESLLRACGGTVQRRRKLECLDLPQTLRLALYVTRSSKSAGGASGNAAARLAALRHDLSPAKAAATIDYLSDQLQERPVVVFGWHRVFLERVGRHFSAPVIDGDTPAGRRVELIQAYEAGQVPILVGQIQAMGLAITLVRGAHAVFGEVHWSAVDLRQAEDRLHRPGQRRNVTYHYLLAENSVDEAVWEVALKKGEAIDRLDQAARSTSIGCWRRSGES